MGKGALGKDVEEREVEEVKKVVNDTLDQRGILRIEEEEEEEKERTTEISKI